MKYPTLAVLIAILSLQSGASLAKFVFPQVGAEGATSLRILISAVILLLIIRPWKVRLDAQSKKLVFIYGSSMGFMNLLFYKALQSIPQGVTVALEFTGPLGLSILLSRKWTDFLWALLASIGLLTLLPLQATSEALAPIGIAYALAAGLFWAIYIYFGEKVGGIKGSTAIAWGMALASLISLPFGLYTNGLALFNPSLLPIMLAIALLSSVIPYSLELHALKKIPAKTFGILMSLEPALAVLCAYVFLQEKITAQQGFAIFLISAASMGTSLMNRKRRS